MAEERAEGEGFGVGGEVSEELAFGGVGREVVREGEVGELAKVLGEVEGEAVVGVAVPEGGNGVGLLQDEEGEGAEAEGGRDSQPRWACANYNRALHPEPGRLLLWVRVGGRDCVAFVLHKTARK